MTRTLFIRTGALVLAIFSSAVSSAAAPNTALDADIGLEAPIPEMHAPGSTATQPDPVVSVTAPKVSPRPERVLSVNPLWAIPLTQLSETRDRPIFSPSRRPPPPPMMATEPVAVAPPVREQEPPPLSLVGTIVSGDEGFGIFLDRSGSSAFRLKIGENYGGWKLLAVRGREATMMKDRQTAILTLPEPGSGQPVGAVRLIPVSVTGSVPVVMRQD